MRSSSGASEDIVGGSLARSKRKGRVNDKGQDDCAENADRGAVGVHRNRRQRTRGEGDDRDDDTCLCHGLSFDFEDKFHVKSQSQDRRKKEKGSKKSVGYSACVRGRQQGQCRRLYSGGGISMVLGKGR